MCQLVAPKGAVLAQNISTAGQHSMSQQLSSTFDTVRHQVSRVTMQLACRQQCMVLEHQQHCLSLAVAAQGVPVRSAAMMPSTTAWQFCGHLLPQFV